MPNSSPSHARLDLASRLNLNIEMLNRAAKVSPAAFRRLLRISPDHPDSFHTLMQPWQQADFHALDPAWQHLAGLPGKAPHWRAYIERPRGHAKTADMAMQITWILLHAQRPLHGLAAAADRDQASLIRSAIHSLGALNPQLCAELDYRQHLVINRRTGTKLEIISSDAQSSFGLLPDFVICDELCHWEKPELWYSLFSSAAKRPRCLLAVLTNAGVGRGWQWELREAARRSRAWHFSSLPGPCAPWITPENLEEQRALLPPGIFDRLWRNIWQDSGGTFVSLAEAEACRDPSLQPQTASHPGRQYIAAVDYAEKHDYTVGVVLHREGPLYVIDCLDVVRPLPDAPIPVTWVEDWILRIANRFAPVTFVIDEYQMLGTIQKLEHQVPIRRFQFAAGGGNHALAMHLRQLIVLKQLRWYPGCGRLEVPWGRDDLETELASLILKQSPSGRCRLDHLPDATHHDDRAFALGAACLHAAQHPAAPEWLHVTPPTSPGSFTW